MTTTERLEFLTDPMTQLGRDRACSHTDYKPSNPEVSARGLLGWRPLNCHLLPDPGLLSSVFTFLKETGKHLLMSPLFCPHLHILPLWEGEKAGEEAQLLHLPPWCLAPRPTAMRMTDRLWCDRLMWGSSFWHWGLEHSFPSSRENKGCCLPTLSLWSIMVFEKSLSQR